MDYRRHRRRRSSSALGFDYTNGFHDAANAIATSVSTRALTPAGRAGDGRGLQPRSARFLGAQGRQRRSASGSSTLPDGKRGLVVVFAGADRRDRAGT